MAAFAEKDLMSISPLSSNSPLYTTQTQTPQNLRSEFRDLSKALSSGDLQSAQTAFSALTQSNSPLSEIDPNTPIGQDLNAIGKALQSGDIGGAQQAFQQLRQDFQTQAGAAGQGSGQVHRGHGHHGHHAHAQDQDLTTTTTDPTSTDPFDPTQPATGSINITG
jgi:hypothetical protein